MGHHHPSKEIPLKCLFGWRANGGPIGCADWMGYPKTDKRGFSLWVTYMYIYVFVTLFLFDLIFFFVLFLFQHN